MIVAAVVLAGGRGKRMNNPEKQKVTHVLAGKPMIAYTIQTLRKLKLSQIIVVIGHLKEQVMDVVGKDVTFANQEEPLGSGHALNVARSVLDPSIDTVLSLYGDDSAFLTTKTLRAYLNSFEKRCPDVACLTVLRDDPTGLGRIIRDKEGRIVRIVEEKLASARQKRIKEINTGVYLFQRRVLDTYLPMIRKNETGEFFLTDIVELVLRGKGRVMAHPLGNSSEWFGVNSPEQLKEADRRMCERRQS